MSIALLPVWVSRRIPLPRRGTHDGSFCGRRPSSGRGQLHPVLRSHQTNKKALTLAALSSGFYTLLTAARQKSPMVKNAATTMPQPDSTPSEVMNPPEEEAPAPAGPNRLATVEERLLRLQEEFTQLAPDLLSTTMGLSELKGSVGRLKRRLRARQARHRI